MPSDAWPPKDQNSAKTERYIYIPYDQFQTQVTNAYPGTGDAQRWYKPEQKRKNPDGTKLHPNWPSNPDRTYKNKGWIDWSELVDKENRLKIERLSFLDFQQEVINAYPGEDKAGDVMTWYREYRKDNKKYYWPYDPDVYYASKGWISWSDLVSKENFLKKWKPFVTFQVEVQTRYQIDNPEKDVDAERWYHQVREENGWPSDPASVYKDRGWNGFPELIGRKQIEKNRDWHGRWQPE
ncbi:MAG TPA: hypothetical protein VJB95_03370 [Candidatus Paceibacterota bacterium]